MNITTDFINNKSKEFDPEGLLEIAFNLHLQIEKVLDLSQNWEIPEFQPQNIILLGMGGSAIGGDLLSAFMADQVKVPMVVCRDYKIPAFVNENTLCIATSYSGNTEETLTAYEKCVEKRARVVALSSNGKIEELSLKDGAWLGKVPGGYQPRTALGFLFASLYAVMVKTGLYKGKLDDLKNTAEFLKTIANQWMSWTETEENQPLKLAISLKNRIPVVYSSSGYMETIAYRWKCQFNENSKMFATSTYFPELNHNEIVGWGAPEGLLDDKFVIILREPEENTRVKARIELTREYLKKKVKVEEIFPKGETRLERLFYFILFGDLLSIYLAYLYDKDPAEIDAIHWLKKELAKLD
ncbi:MAG: bifunctional phosphoglucose/phosphomannose isomerase [Vulcanimicrobiota bacterium]